MNIMTNTKKLIVLSTIGALFGAQTAQATSAFSPNSTVTITIDSIVNNTNAGDLSGLVIDGLFEMDDLSTEIITVGDGSSTRNYQGLGTFAVGDSFTQSFSAAASVDNGSVDAIYYALGQVDFINESSDSYTIEYTLDYDLNAVVSGDFATSTVALDYYNDLGDIVGYEEADASTALVSIVQAISSESFNLVLGEFEFDTFYADVTITGYAESVSAVPVPAAGWLMLSGLVFLRHYRKQAI